jgi:phosphoglycolate phosphatase
VLFDIDGTLVNDGGASRDAFAQALATVYGYRGDVGRYDFSGRTDPYIAHMVLRDDGFTDEEIGAQLPALWHAYVAGLQRNATPERVRALPGMPALLEALRVMEHITIALLTGNIEPGARLKLGPPALNDYFSFGAFGSDSADRSELPPIAVERASQRDGYRFEGPDVVIIGDSIYDVRCGAPYDATTIAVASGKTSADALRAENPRHFFESAEDLPGMLAAICGG